MPKTHKKLSRYRLNELLNSIPQGEYKTKRAELLKRLDITAPTLGDYRKGVRDIPGEKLKIIADFFQVDIEDLYNTSNTTIEVSLKARTREQKFLKRQKIRK
jgi:transcriptional regulator with XRE-family HTH domain